MKNFRFAALIMAILMLALCFASCAETGSNDTTASQGTTAPAATTETPETTYPVDENGYELDRLPELDYNDKEFVIFTWSNQVTWEWNEDGQTNGDKIHDAVYNRQVRTEERLGIKLVFSKQAGDWNNRKSFITTVEANVESGTKDAFDLIGQYTPAAPIGATKNLYRDLNEMKYLDFDRPWWPSDIRESCHINNNLYFITGDITGTLVRNVQAVLCNLTLADNLKLPNVYELVNNHDWTMDKFIEIAVGAVQGINPDGSPAYSVTIANNVVYDNLFYGGGFRFVEYDADGKLSMSSDLKSDRLETWFQTCKNLLKSNDDVTLLAVNGSNGFASGNVLFHMGQIADVQNHLQSVSFDFAILPYPMYDKDQEDYCSITSYWVTMYSIPTNARDPEMSSAVLECLGSYGYRYLTPVIYQECFQYRFLDTLENAQMFDLLHDTLVFDPGHIFADQLSCFSAFRTAETGAFDSWANCYATNGKNWENALKKLLEGIG